MLDESNPAASTVKAEIDAASIDTRQQQRDTHLRSADFFDVANHPALTIRGVTRPVVLNVEETGRGKDPWGGERIGYTATTKFDRTEAASWLEPRSRLRWTCKQCSHSENLAVPMFS